VTVLDVTVPPAVLGPPVVAGVSDTTPTGRLTALLDAGSLLIWPGLTDGTGVLVADGRVDGSDVVVYVTDQSVKGGALGAAGCADIVRAIDAALARRVPVIGVWHSGGARLQEGVVGLDGVGRVFAAMVRASGRVPQLSVVLGPCAGGAAYGPALTDVVVMAPDGRIFVTGPDVIRTVTGEAVTAEHLGGPQPHGRRSGVVSVVADDEAEALSVTRALTVLLADQRALDLRGIEADPGMRDVLPASIRRAYDVKSLVERVLDPGTGIVLHAGWAPNLSTTIGRLGGRTVGVVANNPMRLAGCLDSSSAEKAAKFVRLCDAFGIPLVVLVDVPGYLPGLDQEWEGVVRRGAKLLHAFAESVVPRVTVVTRKAYGGAYIAMNSRSLGATAVFAWPDSELAVMSAAAAVRILHRRRLADVPSEDEESLVAELADEHRRLVGGLAESEEHGLIDAVIDPAVTRRVVAEAIAEAPSLRGDHTNIPL